MLSVTFLGWQGWMVASEATHILVDPLLGGTVGNGPVATRHESLIWPPRQFHPDACPPIDAIVISHEHEDHFDIASLAQLDRAIEVIASARMSLAARTMLSEMGFRVRWLYPGERARLGRIEIMFVTPDHRESGTTDEWDTVGYLFRHVDGDGAFFSNVDVPFTEGMERVLAAEESVVLIFEAMTLGVWKPGAIQVGAGDAHRPPTHEFPRDPLAALLVGERVIPLPGQTTTMSGGKLVASALSTFLRPAPRADWSEPKPKQRIPASTYDPAPDEIAEVESGLARIAEQLYAGPVYRLLYSLSAEDLGGRIPTLVWLVSTTAIDEVLGYEYQPWACRFAPLEEFDDNYIAKLGCSFADLLALLRGELDLRFVRSFSESWALKDVEQQLVMKTTLLPFFHPQRQPTACLARYRRAWATAPRSLLFRAVTTNASAQ
jgi:hypothetical protein